MITDEKRKVIFKMSLYVLWILLNFFSQFHFYFRGDSFCAKNFSLQYRITNSTISVLVALFGFFLLNRLLSQWKGRAYSYVVWLLLAIYSFWLLKYSITETLFGVCGDTTL
jgi:cobalamin synthase